MTTTTFWTNNGLGATAGSSVSAANSILNGDPDNAALVVSGARTYVTDHVTSTIIASFTTQVFKCVSSTGAPALIGIEPGAADNSLAQASLSGSIFVLIEALPGATEDITRVRTVANGNAAKVQLRTDGKLNIVNAAGAILATTSTALSTNTWYRLDLVCIKGSGTSGTFVVAITSGNGSSALETQSFTATDTGTSDLVGFRAGDLSGITGGHSVWLALPRLELGRSTLMGPYVGPSKLGTTDRVDWREFPFPDLRGVMTVVQTSTGTVIEDAHVTGPSVWVNVPKGHPDLLTLDVTAQGDGPPVTFQIAIAPRPMHNSLLAPLSGDPSDITNWTA